MMYSRAQIFSNEENLQCNLLNEDGTLKKLFLETFINAEPSVGKETFKLPYFSRIGEGTLDPQCYGSLIVLDAYYCFNSAYTLYIILQRMIKDPGKYSEAIVRTVSEMYKKYKSFVESFVDNWHLKSVNDLPAIKENNMDALSALLDTCVVPTETMSKYAAFERKVAEDKNTEPIYGLISLFPCYAFWPWLFGNYKTVSETNVYKGWIKSNQGGRTANTVDSIIETEWIQKGQAFDESTAKYVMKQSMIYEKSLFTEAVPE